MDKPREQSGSSISNRATGNGYSNGGPSILKSASQASLAVNKAAVSFNNGNNSLNISAPVDKFRAGASKREVKYILNL